MRAISNELWSAAFRFRTLRPEEENFTIQGSIDPAWRLFSVLCFRSPAPLPEQTQND